MTGNGNCFVEWKEQFVSQERGHRVVHYFLKDSAGESVLAVVGTERSVRHMFYVVSEEFVRVHGVENSIHAGFKWRSRREVVDWLTSMLSKQHLQGDQSRSPKHDLGQASEFPEYPINGDGAQQIQGRPPRNLNAHNSDIVWSGSSWTCGKQLKHYPAFRRNGTKIAIQSFVFVMAKEENQYVAYLEDMYEDKRGQKKVKVRWFHHTQEVKGVVHLRNSHPKEVFITPYSQVISAECVDGPATVLTREHYEECLAAFRDALSTKLHLCSRQFRSNKIKPFDVSKLRGYFEQPIFSFLYSKPSSGLGSISHGPIGEEEEELSLSENVKLGSKRTRGGRGFETFVTEHFGIEISGSQMITYDPSYRNVSCGFSGKHVEFYRWNSPLFKVDEKIELLCQDSGIRGCWFRCTVLQVSRKHIRVQYDDLQDEDQCSNLEEWIPAFKLAIPDKIGMRCFGRSTIRPAPPVHEQTDLDPKVGSAVDAWWSDGWWEGVVTGINNGSNDDLQVFCPGMLYLLCTSCFHFSCCPWVFCLFHYL
uniref:BAH domain-containing protein n=1 Tax=Rhizophora mucronata TaxID=61149 RepID=A0A2P2JIY0_RHIMU